MRRTVATDKAKAMFETCRQEAFSIHFKDREDAVAALTAAETSMYSTPGRSLIADNFWHFRAQCLMDCKLSAEFERAHVTAIHACHAARVPLGTYTMAGGLWTTTPLIQRHNKDVVLFSSLPDRHIPFYRAWFGMQKMPKLWFSKLSLNALLDRDITSLAHVWIAMDRWINTNLARFESIWTFNAALFDMLEAPQVTLPSCIRTCPYPRLRIPGII